ncbi:MAG: rod shape-determining protein MreC [Alphaproteobacteria bacterium]|nr:rod shape-determining protein MreC [Alphaproteobacteria bacterium]
MPLLFIVLALLLFVFSSLHKDFGHPLKAQVTDAFAPILATLNTPVQTAAVYVSALTGFAALQTENATLAAENEHLRTWYQAALTLRAENESLHRLLNVHLPPGHRHITARVIADSGSPYAHSFLVLAGRQDGVKKGQAALAAGGVIGRVIETGETTARILLLTDINTRIPVTVETTGDRAILAGANTALPVLTHLPPNSTAAIGDRIVTSGHGGLFPYGLPVGEIIGRDEDGVSVRPYASLDRVDFIRIVDKQDDRTVTDERLP